MYLIIVGAGAIARCLTSLALENGHRVAVIAKNKELAQKLLNKFDVKVFEADIAQDGILKEAEVDSADAIIATTSDDSTNLMAMFLGKEKGIKNLVSMLQNTEHQKMFERLGVRVIAEPEKLIAQQLFSFVNSD